ncbi:hypothetical protein PV392_24960 [Streptomyces sp. ME03-5709C]|nr:hypothetical protein [Streptomyces sp. ME03-5709C]
MDFRAERPPHARRFSREAEESFSDCCEGKPYLAVRLDGLPGLPLPLPPHTS